MIFSQILVWQFEGLSIVGHQQNADLWTAFGIGIYCSRKPRTGPHAWSANDPYAGPQVRRSTFCRCPGVWGFKIWHISLTQLVTLTTVLCCHVARDCKCSRGFDVCCFHISSLHIIINSWTNEVWLWQEEVQIKVLKLYVQGTWLLWSWFLWSLRYFCAPAFGRALPAASVCHSTVHANSCAGLNSLNSQVNMTWMINVKCWTLCTVPASQRTSS